jgi:hypothetical protein
MTALNVKYAVSEGRGLFLFNAVALSLTMALIVLTGGAVILIASRVELSAASGRLAGCGLVDTLASPRMHYPCDRRVAQSSRVCCWPVGALKARGLIFFS